MGKLPQILIFRRDTEHGGGVIAWVPGFFAKAHCASSSPVSTNPPPWWWVVDTGLRQNTCLHSGLLQKPQVPMVIVTLLSTNVATFLNYGYSFHVTLTIHVNNPYLAKLNSCCFINFIMEFYLYQNTVQYQGVIDSILTFLRW